ncbi:MAG: DUF484 family protein [Methylococcaceae bacterium]
MTTSTTPPRKRRAPSLTAEKVEAYLRENPDFFVSHADVLEYIRVPHDSGTSISLVERQLGVLREKNARLQAQMAELIDIARDNDALNQRLHKLTLSLLGARDPVAVLSALEEGLRKDFQVDRVVVRCFSRCPEALLAGMPENVAEDGALLFANLLNRGEAWCASIHDTAQTRYLFGDGINEIHSFAVTAIEHAGLQGVLALGSFKSEHFKPGMGLLYLRILGEVVAARLATWTED